MVRVVVVCLAMRPSSVGTSVSDAVSLLMTVYPSFEYKLRAACSTPHDQIHLRAAPLPDALLGLLY